MRAEPRNKRGKLGPGHTEFEAYRAGAARAGNAQCRNAAIVTSEHHVIRELAAHGAAFCVAAGIGAIILYPYYWFFEANTENATIALEAYLASCFVVGGVDSVITWLFFWLRRRQTRIDEQVEQM